MIEDMVNDMNYQTGLRIAKRRKEKGYTQAQLGELIGVGNRHISNIERGKSNCSTPILLKICGLLEVSPNYLLYGSIHENNLRKNIIDNIRLCSDEDLPLINEIINVFVKKSNDKFR